MFYYLEGIVTLIENNLAVIDIGGAGYCCYASVKSLSCLEVGKKAKLFTYCNIKEDAFDIYGFYTTGEKRCFEMLLSVSGVGPKAAMAILSSATAEDMAMAVVTDNEKVFTAAPGIGKRLAQRIILELKDKISKETTVLRESGFASSSSAGGMAGGKLNDASAALLVLGYTQSEITAAMRGVDVEALTVEQIIKQVLNTSRLLK